MQQENLGFHPLAQHMPYKVRKYADQDIYVKEDDLKENFDKLRNILRDNFRNMQVSRIELKKGFDEKKCNNVNDINLEKNVYFVIFPTGERISFSPSGITASNGANITSKNARNLYADPDFQTQLTFAIETGNSQPLLDLLSQYSSQNCAVNNKHTRQNLYRKTKDNAANTTTYTPVGQNYNMGNFYQNAVNNYNHSQEARPFEIRNYQNQSQPGQIYYEYEYDPDNMCIRNPDIVGRAQVYQDMHEREQRNRFNQLREYSPKLWNYEINFRRPLYFIDYGSCLVPVYPSL